MFLACVQWQIDTIKACTVVVVELKDAIKKRKSEYTATPLSQTTSTTIK
jgi:hypothetical protein